MDYEDFVVVFIMIGTGFLVGVLVTAQLNEDKAKYQVNLAKFEIMYEKCMGHKKATVSECKELAEFKSMTLVSGD